MENSNRQVLLAQRPRGLPQTSDFQLVETRRPRPAEREFLVQAEFLSVDPYMRGRMNDVKSYADPVAIGQVMVGESVGVVLESNHPKFKVGSRVAGQFGWQEFAVSDGTAVRRIDALGMPPATALHVLGMPGLTAYFGLLDVCRIEPQETVVVSGAAGAVGSTAGQLAKLTGCRVIGIAGTDEKIEFITEELGFDGGFNYHTADDYGAILKELCPAGIDAYFDNVGGPITDAVIPQLNVNARVAICGQISQYNSTEVEQGPRLFWHLIVKRAQIRGFLVLDFAAQFPSALTKLHRWVESGEIKYRERITEGMENAPQAFIEMLQGANLGKQLVRISVE